MVKTHLHKHTTRPRKSQRKSNDRDRSEIDEMDAESSDSTDAPGMTKKLRKPHEHTTEIERNSKNYTKPSHKKQQKTQKTKDR